MMKINEMVRSYLETALWSSCDEDGEPMDNTYTIHDFHPNALRAAQDTCDDFMRCVADDDINVDMSDSAMGHNLWLTAARHGAGFWDLGLGVTGTYLTNIAHNFHADVYVGDDGMLHLG